MGTPFITLQEPTPLEGFLIGKPHEEQPTSIPKAFSDAMEVRHSVFVQEQKVPAENEFDADDSRSCHWIVYASVNKVIQDEVVDEGGNIVTPRRSSTRSTPIGTIRLVPFPHEPHPVNRGVYWNGILTGVLPEGEDSPTAAAATGGEASKNLPSKQAGGTATVGSPTEHFRPHPDRATTFHDGREPYVKLGRLAVSSDFRGHGLAKLLVSQALSWLRSHRTYFNPSIAELGLEGVGAASEKEIPKWGGLVCVHAQEAVVGAWARFGFKVDEGMGRWMEEGIWHVGMFLRLDFGKEVFG